MRLFYLCPDLKAPTGGVTVIYRHVDILRRRGFEAYVVHEREGFRCRWFENETPVIAWSKQRDRKELMPARRSARFAGQALRRTPPGSPFLHLLEPPRIEFAPEDIVVVPELFGPGLAEIAPGVAKVIFNQNPYETFYGYPRDLRGRSSPYRHPEVVATFVISEDARRVIEYVFPGITTYRVKWSIDPGRFRAEGVKSRRIAYMPRKGAKDAAFVLAVAAARGALAGYEIAPIAGLDEDGVAACLRESLLFLSLGYHEGCPLPPAEAMACGAIVVGYDGFGGAEYLLPELSFPVPTGDLVAFAQTLEHVLRLEEEQPGAAASPRCEGVGLHRRDVLPRAGGSASPRRLERRDRVAAAW